jgi:hypothetical protein
MVIETAVWPAAESSHGTLRPATARCSLDEKGDTALEAVDTGLLVHHTPDGIRCVHVARECAVDRFIDAFQETDLQRDGCLIGGRA